MVAAAIGRRGELVDASEVARRFGVSRGWVYEHAGELGALRLGGGPRPRLRFELAAVDAALRSGVGQQERGSRGSRRRRAKPATSGVELLPVGPAPRVASPRGTS